MRCLRQDGGRWPLSRVRKGGSVMLSSDSETFTYTALFPFGGIGAGARGFLDAQLKTSGVRARFLSLGGIDSDPAACRDFEYLTGSPSLCADVSTLQPEQLLAFVGKRAPDVVFMSPPCKGASGLLSQAKSETEKYREMNKLALHWIALMMRTWGDQPPRLVLLENVPRLTTRAAAMLKEVRKMLTAAGYVCKDGYHDCGELGGLAQHRRRYLLVARHTRRAAPLLYQPVSQRVRACGEVLGPLPMPGDPAAGPMHVMPRISWLNWVRLALIPAGGDWRDLPGVLEKGQARRTLFKRHRMEQWSAPVGTVGGSGSNAVGNIADPRPAGATWGGGDLGVIGFDEPAGAIQGESWPRNGRFSVADPRLQRGTGFANSYRIEPWTAPAGAVTSGGHPSNGGGAVADPRVKRAFDHGYAVLDFNEPSPTVAGGSHPGQGAYSVGDPRWRDAAALGCSPRAGAWGVIPWSEAAKTVTGHGRFDNGAFAVADPRLPPGAPPVMVVTDPRKPPSEVPVIIAEDGTWHRPMTTLELAALQGLPTVWNGKPLKLDGNSSSAWRERIGNAVPPPAGKAIAERMLLTLLQNETQTFSLAGVETSVWVEPETFDQKAA
ncbi:MAG TPA: DNA cytosine methyltransferase [Polyangia bacterium]|nr:DNA cytosine methyltransferase [Polyangia bacterium]